MRTRSPICPATRRETFVRTVTSAISIRSIAAATALVLGATSLGAQQPTLQVQPSTRATALLTLNPPRVEGQPATAPLTVTIDYGQPHRRGRAVPTELSEDGTIWRTGANAFTRLSTQAALVLGDAAVPAGEYALFTVREAGRYFLIINSNTEQSGATHLPAKDLVRVPMRARTLAEPRESLQIALVPSTEPPAKGVLSISWGTLELTVDWSVR